MGRKSKQGQNWVSNQVFIEEVVVRDKISLAPEPHLRCYTLFYETVENGWPVPNRESWDHFLFYGRHTYPRGEMTAICELEKVKEGIISFSRAVKAKVKLYNIAKLMCICSSTSKFISHVMYYVRLY